MVARDERIASHAYKLGRCPLNERPAPGPYTGLPLSGLVVGVPEPERGYGHGNIHTHTHTHTPPP